MSNASIKKDFNDISLEITVINEIKDQIKIAQQKAMLSANKEMIVLYWNIGKVINFRSEWGSKFIERLSLELKKEFPKAKGYSLRNLKNMLRFYREYPDIEFVQSVTAQIPWTHNVELFRVGSLKE